MANRYWVGGTGNWSDATNHWASVSNGTPAAGNLPVSGDACYFDSSSGTGTCTVDSALSGISILIGPSNVSSVSVSLANTFSGLLGVYRGSFYSNGYSMTLDTIAGGSNTTKTLDITNSTVNITTKDPFSIFQYTGLTFVSNGSTINLTYSGSVYSAIYLGSASFNNLTMYSTTGVTDLTGTGTPTINNFTIYGTANKTCATYIRNNITINNSLTITGNSAINRPLISAYTLGTPITITLGASATFKSNSGNFDLRDIAVTGGAANELDWTTGSPPGTIGDCQGNSGVTFTTGSTAYWTHSTSASYNWSDSTRWFQSDHTTSFGRVPLPQDDVKFDSGSFGATGKTVNQDMPRMAKNIDWTGATNSPTWKTNNISQQIFGSLTMVTGMTFNGGTFEFLNRSNCTLTTAGQQIYNLSIYAVGASVGCADNLTLVNALHLYNGDINFNGHNLTTLAINSNVYTSRSFSNSGTWTVSGGSSGVSISIRNDGLASFSAPSILYLTNTSVASAVFTLSTTGLVYNDIVITPHATYTVTFTYPFTFNNMSMSTSGGRIIKFAGGNNFITTGTQFLAGSASGNVTITSTNTTQFTLTKNSGANIRTNYVTMSYSKFATTGTVKAYAGLNSTDAGNNNNWTWGNGDTSNAIMFGDMF